MRNLWPVAIAIMLAASQCAFAQDSSHIRYKWQDAQGLVHFSDSLSTDAMKFGYTLVNDQGVVIGRVARQLTTEERAAANKAAEKKAAEERAVRELANAEAQMLNAYPDEEAYRISQQQTLDTFDQQIHTTQLNLRSQEKALTDLLDRAADLERSKLPVPAYLSDSIAKQRNVVSGQRSSLARSRAERAKTVVIQRAQLTRYRELMSARENRQ